MKRKSVWLPLATAGCNVKAIAIAALLLAGELNGSMAQKRTDISLGNEAPSSLTGIYDLSGEDPSADLCTTGRPQTDANKIFCLYNAAANKFLNIGGSWGTHTVLNSTPFGIWLEKGTTSSNFYLNCKVDGSGTGTHIGISKKSLWCDRSLSGNGAGQVPFSFEKAEGYTEKNKVYRINNGANYITAFPDDKTNTCNIASAYSTTDSKYKYQIWKLLSKAEYYKLFLANPANMSAPVDASFLLEAPEFRANDTDIQLWKLSNESLKDKIFYGDNYMYSTYESVKKNGNGHFINYDGNHQNYYGKYFYCYTKEARDFYLYQDVKVEKAGWYILRCNGCSSANSNEVLANEKDEQPIAYLFAARISDKGVIDSTTITASSLNSIDRATAKSFLEGDKDGKGAGMEFYNGKYENQVQLCIEKGDDGEAVSTEHPATIRLGFYVEKGLSTPESEELTAVDNFKLLYAGPRRMPELILDENQTNLKYLTLATDEYKNSILHLNRTLNPQMWNSIILPVNLTAGQLKRTFGDEVKIAKLANLTDHSVQFTTEETENDTTVILKAFTPYIIYPPVTKTYSPSYTAEKFYTKEGEDNSEWLGKDYNKSTDENDRFSLTVPPNHYDITMVSFDRDKFNEYVNTDGNENWVSKTTFSAEGKPGHMECLGTMAKTYDENGIIEGRDNLNGDYFMYKGKLIQVPNGKKDNGEEYSYGLKAFRCWFELTGKDNIEGGGSSTQMALFIDGVKDNTTGIDDIHAFDEVTSYKRGINGVFNLNGQMVRSSNAIDRLPKGLYVVNGKKIVIR